MNPNVTVVDYGVGNLFSVCRALEHCGAGVAVSGDPAVIMASPRVVLPGVGAFADGMQGLAERGLDRAMRGYAASGRPLLGICLGMQLLVSTSEEFGVHAGLGIIPGRVVAIPAAGADGRPHKIPHVGWSPLKVPEGRNGWDDSILKGVAPGESVYLVHSYSVVPDDEAARLADCDYDGRLISAAIQQGNVAGCQFHPEKSGPAGLKILHNFIHSIPP
jgi:imidazole glycerol phosphate synthase, glutamine amidotransferase subunit